MHYAGRTLAAGFVSLRQQTATKIETEAVEKAFVNKIHAEITVSVDGGSAAPDAIAGIYAL